MKSKYLLFVLGVVIGLGLVFVGWQLAQRNYRYNGSLIDPPAPATNFNLTDQNGLPYQLSDQVGKLVLIFFGYTHCPDVCPVTLSQFKQVKQQLGKRSKDVEFVFITVDPQRDTVEEIKRYVPNFDPGFIGLTGSSDEIEQVQKDYGVFVNRQAADEQGNYLLDHTARIYVVDQQGNWRMTFPFGMETGQIVSDLEHLLR